MVGLEQSWVSFVGRLGPCTPPPPPPGMNPESSGRLAFYSTVVFLGSFKMHPDVQLVVTRGFGAGCPRLPAVDMEVDLDEVGQEVTSFTTQWT